MVNQIAVNVQMENAIKVQKKVIRELEEKIDDAEKLGKGDQVQEIDNLVSEIHLLNKTNQEKMKILENIEKEKEMLKDKVENVEKEKSEMKEDLKGFQKVTTMQEELYHLEKLGKSFECNICGLAFETKSELEVHVRKTRQIATWKSKLMEMETENSQLKYRLSLDLFRMKEHI